MAISYDKNLRASAIRQGVDLFTVGYRAAKGKGCGELQGPLDWAMGQALFTFCFHVRTGMSPRDALDKVEWPEPKPETPA